MPIFKYKAIKTDGKTIAGFVESVSEKAAGEILEDKGMKIVSLEEEAGIGGKKDFFLSLVRIKPKDIAVMSRQFSVLVSAGVALVQALRILTDQTDNTKLRAIVQDIADEVDGGARLSDALAKRPKVFSDFYTSVVKSGESSGKLDDVLNYLADELEKDYDMMSKIRGAMIYPAFVFCGLAGVGVMMMIFVVPKLTAVLEETGAELPFATRVLIGLSGFLSGYWWAVLLIIAGIVIALRVFIHSAVGRIVIDNALLRLPIFGRLFQRIYLVRFTRSLQTLIVGGVSISKALRITAEVVTNKVYQDLVKETIQEVEDGNSVTSVFITSNRIPKMVSQMMNIGEKTGRLDVILGRITDFYSREINNILANLMTLMEPIIMVIIGIAVGMMVAAIIMPMYNMAQGV